MERNTLNPNRATRCSGLIFLVGVLIAGSAGAAGVIQAAAEVAAAGAVDELSEIVVEGKGPRFVAPTRRDSIGRIWAPVFVNGRGPFRLVLDTGASQSAVTAQLAAILGIKAGTGPDMMLRGVTGSATVSSIRVATLTVGDLELDGPILPIVPDAMGGAEGILGTKGMMGKRIAIDFRHDKIDIVYSRGERAGYGFEIVPFKSMREQLVVVNAVVGGVRTKAVIDTGGQLTIGNLALRDALMHRSGHHAGRINQFAGATMELQEGEVLATPPIEFGRVRILDSGVTYADAYIFTHWQLTHEPAILIGMDVLGLLDDLIIDFRRQELQIRTRNAG
jgi:predicted aspartyl protease